MGTRQARGKASRGRRRREGSKSKSERSMLEFGRIEGPKLGGKAVIGGESGNEVSVR